MLFLFCFVCLFNSFLFGGWNGLIFYFSNFLCLNLAYMSIFVLGLVFLSELEVALIGLSVFIVMFSLLFFSSSGFLMLFMNYELLMLPMMLMIHFYGNQPEKVGSLYYLFIYMGSFGLSFLYIILSLKEIEVLYFSSFFSLYLLGLFVVKCPLFSLHLWLPKAHVEAPTTASMLLAGLLLKVGLYGVWIVMPFLKLSPIWVGVLSFLGYLLAPFLCIFSSESKEFMAYSSVSHINFVLHGLMYYSVSLNTSSFFVSLSHGYISVLGFYMVGNMSHASGSRIIYYFIGMTNYCGFLLFCCSLVMLSNAGVPPYLSFWGEMMTLISLMGFEFLFFVSVLVYFLFSFYYSVYLIMQMMKGMGVFYNYNMSNLILVGIIPIFYVFIFSF